MLPRSNELLIKRKIVVCVAVVVVIGLACLGGRWAAFALLTHKGFGAQGKLADRLSILPSDLLLGDLWGENPVKRTLHLSNHGSHPIHICQFKTSCSCASVVPSSLVLNAGDEACVEITLDLRESKRDISNREKFEVDITPCVDAKLKVDESVRWRLSGRRRQHVRIQSDQLSFYRSSHLDESPIVLKARIEAHSSIERIEVACSGSCFRCQVSQGVGNPRLWEVLLTPTLKLPPGKIECTLTIVPIGADGTRYSSYSVPVRGMVEDDIQPLIPELLYGHQAVGATIEQHLTLKSHLGKPFNVLSVAGGHPALKISQDACDRCSFSYLIRCDIGKDEEIKSVIRFKVRDSTLAERTIEIPVFAGRHGQEVR